MFRLDGGAMFGSVPKALWSRMCVPDDENRILMATRSLVIDDGDRRFLVDVGCGDKWNGKTRAIFQFEEGPYRPVPGVTDVVLTHLHFDHAGGVSRFLSDGGLALNYPDARHHVSRANLDNASNPNPRERASYLAENVQVLQESDLNLIEDGEVLCPGITLHQSDGHTRGLCWVEVSDGGETLAFPADLIPLSHHLPLAYHMGYDMCAEKILTEKAAFLSKAVEERWTVVFEHDPSVVGGNVGQDESGRFRLMTRAEIPEL